MASTTRRSLLAAAAAASLAGAARAATPGWRDVLDTPALPSPLAARGLVNALARAGQRLVAAGQRGHVLTSDDRGEHWQQAAVPVSSDLVALSFATPQAGWAVGHDGVVLHSADGGQRWQRQLDGHAAGRRLVAYYGSDEGAAAVGDVTRLAALRAEAGRFAAQGAENPLLDVWFDDATTGYVVGAFGQLFATRDGGKTWDPLLHATENPKALHLYAVRSIGGELYIAGEQGLLMKLDRAAGRWRALTLPYPGTMFGLVGNQRVLLAHGLRGTLLRSTDAGRSWHTVPTGLQLGLTAATVLQDGRLVIASQAGHLLASRDDGATFQPLRTERPVPAAAIAEAAPGRLVVAGPRGLHTVAVG
jgi:photosystem II stability/assembly factor-like uncharacterized protein